MVFEVRDALRVIESDKGTIGGLYYSRRPPYFPLVFTEDLTEEKYVFRSINDFDIPDKPFLCKGLGTGFLSIKHDTLKKIWSIENDRPFNFMPLPNGDQYGEDLSFFRRCNVMGLEIWCEPRVDIGHLSNRVIYRHHHQMRKSRDFHYCNPIVGWMTVREQNWLYEKAKGMKSVVEIGSWKGKSTHIFCCAVNGTVTAIDHFKGTEDDAARAEIYNKAFKEVDEGIDIYEIFKKNTGMFNNLRVIKMSSQDAFKKYDYELEADMIFIDGGHEYDEVMADLVSYEPLAKKLICGHDYTNFPGVQAAVNEYFDRDVNVHDTIWYVEK
jgi:hypothetical protein